VKNRSEQFEARLVMVEVLPSPSLFFAGIGGQPHAGAPPAHGEGRALFDSEEARSRAIAALRFVDKPRRRGGHLLP